MKESKALSKYKRGGKTDIFAQCGGKQHELEHYYTETIYSYETDKHENMQHK